MLDINLIRQKPEYVKERLAAKGCHADIDLLLKMDADKRQQMVTVEQKKAEQNKVSKQIPLLKKEGKDVAGIMEEMKRLAEEIKVLDEQLNVVTSQMKQFMDALPNLPDDDVVPGGKENNRVVHSYGEKPSFSFEPKDHMTLAASLDLIDYPRGAKLGGNGFWVYKGMGARLEWALLNFFIDTHIADGYEFILPPHILTYQCGYTAGQFPKFEEDVFTLNEGQQGDKFNFFLLPTAETALVNLYRDEILSVSYTHLFFSTNMFFIDIFVAYIGLFLVGCTYIAIGILVSSMTESQVVSAIVTFAAMLLVFAVQWMTSSISSSIAAGIITCFVIALAITALLYFTTKNWIASLCVFVGLAAVIVAVILININLYAGLLNSIVTWFSVIERFYEFTSGSVSISSLVYLISFPLALLYITVYQIEKRRWA